MYAFNGKAIYKPKGKAGEYAGWACNFYNGCSNGCTYCYLRKGVLAHVMGGDKPTLKKCFKDEAHALDVFEKELKANLPELQKHGLFFSFTTDPLLYETKELTMLAVNECLYNDIPVKLLTKCTKHISQFAYELECTDYDLSQIAFGFTLTGHDEIEPKASTNAERIEAMRKLNEAGFKTFASIEPIIDFPSAKDVINASIDFCDLYKIGLMSGAKYDIVEAQTFVEWLNELEKPKIYLKESLQKLSRYTIEELDDYFVTRDYNLFK